MKILLILRDAVDFRYLSDVVPALGRRGHSLKILVGGNSKVPSADVAIYEYAQGNPNIEYEFLPEPIHQQNIQERRKYWLRCFINYLFYFQKGHPSPQLRSRWRVQLPFLAQRLLQVVMLTPLRVWLTSPSVRKKLGEMANRQPVNDTVFGKIQEYSPAVVIVSPLVKSGLLELESLRAARKLQIPSIYALSSWDNLTSRGIIQYVPDAVFVWNTSLLEEAVLLHGIPKERIWITGAPTFDFWFGLHPRKTREEFCYEVGLNPTKPYVVYLASSKSIIKNETLLVSEISKCVLQVKSDPEFQILVRPHPLNAKFWEEFDSDEIVVWPRSGQWPDTAESQQDYYHTLYYSAAVAGLNTSAFLDAAVLDKPCIVIIDNRYSIGQEGRGHFKHLLNARFLEEARTPVEAARVFTGVLRGHDAKKTERRQFVQDFLRPRGLSIPASEVYAGAVEAMVQGKKPEELTLQ